MSGMGSVMEVLWREAACWLMIRPHSRVEGGSLGESVHVAGPVRMLLFVGSNVMDLCVGVSG